jgi:molybdopterin molybdotransferase
MPPGSPSTISFSQALAIVTEQADHVVSGLRPAPEHCELVKALGRVLAEPIAADRDQPPFHRVTRDGFAVRASDIGSGIPLRVIGQIRAGEAWAANKPPLQAGEALEIMTGAPLPRGADAVLMVEHAREISFSDQDGPVLRQILPLPGRTLHAGENVVAQGSEAHQGEPVLTTGTRLLPEEIALAAACGLNSVPVYEQPTVAILPTGDELHSTADDPTRITAHQIYDSNSVTLAALVRQAGGIPRCQPIARDEKNALHASIQQALQTAPLLLMTGGVSMGRYDLVEEVLASLGATFFFTGVKMQPGKPVVFGQLPATDDRSAARYFFGLPGNPVSAMVTFRVFAQPLLAALAGQDDWQPQISLAQLAAPISCPAGLTRFLPGILDTTGSMPTITPISHRGSGDLAAHARANAYAIVPEDRAGLAAEETIRILLR